MLRVQFRGGEKESVVFCLYNNQMLTKTGREQVISKPKEEVFL